MPGSVTSAFSEPEDFEAACRAEGCCRLLITGRGQFCASVIQIALHVLRLSATQESLSRIAFMSLPADMVLLTFPLSGAALPIYGGIGSRSGELVTLGPDEQLHARTEGGSHAGGIWLPIKELAQYGSAITGAPFALPPGVRHWRPASQAEARLRSLHAAAIRMATNNPANFIDAEAAHGLEQQLIHSVVDCLAGGSETTDTRSARRHQSIMIGFERLLQAEPERNIPITEICATLGVSPRLLRSLCAEHLGMGPARYDRLRRMSLVRRSLRRGDSALTGIAEVAARYGFGSPGRFAVKYNASFGESPSATVRRATPVRFA